MPESRITIVARGFSPKLVGASQRLEAPERAAPRHVLLLAAPGASAFLPLTRAPEGLPGECRSGPITTHLPFGGGGRCCGTINFGSALPTAASKIRRNDHLRSDAVGGYGCDGVFTHQTSPCVIHTSWQRPLLRLRHHAIGVDAATPPKSRLWRSRRGSTRDGVCFASNRRHRHPKRRLAGYPSELSNSAGSAGQR